MARSKKTWNERNNSPFAIALSQLMMQKGISQEELAKTIEKTRQTVSQYMNGISEPGYETLCKIAEFFGVSVDYLLGRTNIKTPDATMQAVIEYTGLTEDNVSTLHYMTEGANQTIVRSRDESGGGVAIDGCKPFLDCLNDVMDAIYYDREAFVKNYVQLRRASWENVDFWYLDGLEISIKGVPATGDSPEERLEIDNRTVEHACIKLSRMIEQKMLERYLTTEVDFSLMRGNE